MVGFNTLSSESRQRKMDLFQRTFAPNESTRILDIGGEANDHASQLIELHPWKQNLTVLNIMPEHLAKINERYPEITTLAGDARQIEFPDQSFDIVFSNAVIEHVGGFEDQQRMAREVMRVGKAWFITTPNRWYPFEFHTRLPLIGWLPAPMMQAAARVVSYNHVHRRYSSGNRTHTWLLSGREMRKLFPGSRVIHMRVTFFPETIVVIGAHDPACLHN